MSGIYAGQRRRAARNENPWPLNSALDNEMIEKKYGYMNVMQRLIIPKGYIFFIQGATI